MWRQRSVPIVVVGQGSDIFLSVPWTWHNETEAVILFFSELFELKSQNKELWETVLGETVFAWSMYCKSCCQRCHKLRDSKTKTTIWWLRSLQNQTSVTFINILLNRVRNPTASLSNPHVAACWSYSGHWSCLVQHSDPDGPFGAHAGKE